MFCSNNITLSDNDTFYISSMEMLKVQFEKTDIGIILKKNTSSKSLYQKVIEEANRRNPGLAVIDCFTVKEPYSIVVVLTKEAFNTEGLRTDLSPTSGERKTLENISKIIGHSKAERDQLYFTFQTIKLQGKAYFVDVTALMSLGIPICHQLATLKSVPLTDILHFLESSSVPYIEITNALTMYASAADIEF